MGIQNVLHFIVFADVAEPTIQLCDKDDINFITPDGVQQGHHGGALLNLLAGRETSVSKDAHDLHTVLLGIAFQVILLVVDRKAILDLLFGGYAGV